MRLSLLARLARNLAGPVVAALLLAGAAAAPATAATHDTVIPAGVACAGFDLGIDFGAPVGGSVGREFRDHDGNVVRTLTAGTGYALTFHNDEAGKSLALPSNGYASTTRFGPDGLATVASQGHTVIILFPTDHPAGPSTTLYVGRVVYTVDGEGTFTLVSTAGAKVDICAALS